MLRNKLFLIMVILFSCLKLPISYNTNISKKVSNFNEHIALLEIPKINLYGKLYEKNSPLNDVDKNLMIIGDMPSENGKFIIAGHSGVGDVSYFNDLVYLNINDKINIYYNNKIYEYVIFDIYDIEKTGKLYLNKNENNIIILVTCKIGTDKQTIYKGILKDIDNYVNENFDLIR